MVKNKRLAFKEIARLLRDRKKFFVESSNERRDALLAASALNVEITTNKDALERFHIIYLP